MSATVTERHPLQPLPMATNQRTGSRRRSARLAFGEEERVRDGYSDGTAKKSKSTNGTAGAGKRVKTCRSHWLLESQKVVLTIEAAIYEEDDNGFTFTRAKSKPTRLKAAARPRTEPIVEDDPPPDPVKQVRKAKEIPGSPDSKDEKGRRKTRKRSIDDTSKLTEPSNSRSRDEQATPEPEKLPERRLDQGAAGEKETKIALPFSDTPVIQRNKAMRTARASGIGNRRSSLGMRGRRASSLIEQGGNAIPHKEVAVKDFYKHIASDGISEPRRMKQLLTWCATRVMGEKAAYASGVEGSARAAARVIQEELLKDIANRSEMSDWFNREEIQPAELLVKKPNPRNIANAQKVQDLEREIADLRVQKASYTSLLTLRPPAPSALSQQAQNPSLLPADQLPLHQLLSQQEPLHRTTHTRLSALTSTLELSTDTLSHAVHAIESWRTQAERVGDAVLGGVAARLEERKEQVREKAGTKNVDGVEVLRALAGALDGDG
ncbi:MAG: hypothetical protein M1814_004951 [Vezdaea aestivalis]|nr:MAG: hypothetical protein M1814_004951 [Vezdaea aestivalis]